MEAEPPPAFLASGDPPRHATLPTLWGFVFVVGFHLFVCFALGPLRTGGPCLVSSMGSHALAQGSLLGACMV